MPSRILSSCSRSSGRSRSVSKRPRLGLRGRPRPRCPGTTAARIIVLRTHCRRRSCGGDCSRIHPDPAARGRSGRRPLSLVYSMTLFVLLGALGSSAAAHDPIGTLLPGVVYDTVCRRARRPARRRHPRPTSRKSGSTGERYATSTGAATPARPLSRFLVFALAVILGVGGLTARLFYLQIVERRPVRRAVRRGNRTVARGDPVAARPDLRPRGDVLVTNVADVRGQDPAGRPAR